MVLAPDEHLLVGVFGAILDDQARVLLVERADLDMWCLPGGLLEVGESVTAAVVRECAEEIGLEVRVERMVGVYSDPARHLFRYKSGMMKHFVTIVFKCCIVGGEIRCSDEVRKVGYFGASMLDHVVPSHRVWIEDALAGSTATFMR